MEAHEGGGRGGRFSKSEKIHKGIWSIFLHFMQKGGEEGKSEPSRGGGGETSVRE